MERRRRCSGCFHLLTRLRISNFDEHCARQAGKGQEKIPNRENYEHGRGNDSISQSFPPFSSVQDFYIDEDRVTTDVREENSESMVEMALILSLTRRCQNKFFDDP